ncbi:MAG: radical SAM family heme chaperone HemW [Acidobacteriota bacterium]|nr:radical SAM family heme chaperone HemW [Acidobacteriota bacterium]MDQ7087249.1 radical SAM family heme chaperone HemW [Acidobacteriota bacterium]
MSASDPIGVYIHVPFCAYRCAYCDFAVVTGQLARAGEYLAAVQREIEAFRRHWGPQSVETLYFGGGTPSRLDPDAVARLLEAVAGLGNLEADAEISLEANPDDLTPERLAGLRRAGVTRLTVGLQAVDDQRLEDIGRPLPGKLGLVALARSLEAGFASVGADLIFGTPGQATAPWMAELEAVLQVGPPHISAYALETTSRTRLVRAVERGELPAPDPDHAATLYEMTCQRLGQAGLERYEISNFARPGHRSRHNRLYWRDRPFVGFGPSAASYFARRRWTNPRRLSEYLRTAGESPPGAAVAPCPADRLAGEALVFGLRLAEGVDFETVSRHYGEVDLAPRRRVLDRAVATGLVARQGSRYRLTGRGVLLADEVFVDLL